MGDKEGLWLLVSRMWPGPKAERRDSDCVYGSMRMGASSLNRLFLTDLHCLPWFINVSESQGPGTILQSFSFNCSSHTPTLELLHVQPPTTFFNPPSLTRWQGIYVGKVGSWAQLGTMGEQGQTLNSQSQRWHRGMEILGPTWHCPPATDDLEQLGPAGCPDSEPL